MMKMQFSKERFLKQMGSMVNTVDKKWADKMEGAIIFFPKNKTVTQIGGVKFDNSGELITTYIHISWCEPIGEKEEWYEKMEGLGLW